MGKNFEVAIIGRPNVGKSTLFNRLVGSRSAIVDDKPGVTRDRHYGECFWNGVVFNVIDTGGFAPNDKEVFNNKIAEQVMVVIKHTHCILFMVDVETGITNLEYMIYDLLRKNNKKYFLVVNKVDNNSNLPDTYEFYKLSNEDIYPISASSGSGTGDLLDAIVKSFPKLDKKESDEKAKDALPKFAIVGRPNVGKSSFLNTILDQNRSIVSDIPGTTRDSINTKFNRFNKAFFLIDTAGIRRKKQMIDNIEFYSSVRTHKAIDDSDVCILMIDIQDGLTSQDMDIFDTIIQKGKGVVLVANKWDIMDKDANTAVKLEKEMRKKLLPFSDIPIFFASTIEKKNLLNIFDEAIQIYQRRLQRISTSMLNKLLEKMITKHQPPSYRGNIIKINYISQLRLNYPTFVLFSNYPKAIKQPYKNYIENAFRKELDFNGVPIRLFFRKK